MAKMQRKEATGARVSTGRKVEGKTGKTAFGILSAHACKLSFLFALAAGYALLPSGVWSEHTGLAVFFMATFALTLASVAYSFREKMAHAKNKGIVSLAASAIGLAALSACSAPVACGAASAGVLSIIFPSVLLGFFSQWGPDVVALSIFAQLIALAWMNSLSLRSIARLASS